VRSSLFPGRSGALSVSLSASLLLAATLVGCGGEAADRSTTTTTTAPEPAPQFGSSMGTEPGDVDEVAALGDGPAADQVWEIPVGISICGRYVEVPQGLAADGVTAGPATTRVTRTGSGEVPTLRAFAESAGLQIAAARLTLPDDIVPPTLDVTDPPMTIAGRTFATGETCGDVTAEVQVWVYSTEARASGDGILIVTQDLANVPFSDEGMAVVVAFAPESSLPTLPPSAFN
jgi:hypothetical protein